MISLSLATILGLAALGAWVYLVYAHAGFWRADQWLGPVPAGGRPKPAVVAIVPARNEAATIARTAESLMAQHYDGPFAVVVVDDSSSDGTGELAREALSRSAGGRVFSVVTAPPLPPGWSGKLAAMDCGVREAGRLLPEAQYFWFSDADIVHGPRTLARLVGRAGEGFGLVSLMVRLDCRGMWDRLLIPAFVFFFQMLYPFPSINAKPPRIGGAAGGCLLLGREALARIGGLASVKGALIDDCALAEAVRREGFRLWLGHADDSRSLRAYGGLGETWRMVARTAYTQLGYSPLKLAGTVLGMGLVFLAAPLVVLLAPWHGSLIALLAGLAAIGLMLKAYEPTLRLYGLGPAQGLALPAAAALYTAMTVDSARRHWQGLGGAWKARTYDFG
jgi:hopene-associated glycosyltransferase HpnB